VFGNVHEKE